MRVCNKCNNLYDNRFKWCPFCGNQTSIKEITDDDYQKYIFDAFEDILGEIKVTIEQYNIMLVEYCSFVSVALDVLDKNFRWILEPRMDAMGLALSRINYVKGIIGIAIGRKRNSCWAYKNYIFKYDGRLISRLIKIFSDKMEEKNLKITDEHRQKLWDCLMKMKNLESENSDVYIKDENYNMIILVCNKEDCENKEEDGDEGGANGYNPCIENINMDCEYERSVFEDFDYLDDIY